VQEQETTTKLIGSVKEQTIKLTTQKGDEHTIKLTTQKGDEKDHNDNLTQQEGIIIAISANK
jgi:hypothetical protein